MRRLLVREFFLCLIGAALLTILLKKSAGSSCCPVFFSMTTGLLIGSFHYIPNMIWYHFPFNYSMVGMADDFISMTLGGLAIATFVLKTGPCTMGKCTDKKSCH